MYDIVFSYLDHFTSKHLPQKNMQDYKNGDYQALGGPNPTLIGFKTPEYQKTVDSVQEVFNIMCEFRKRATLISTMKEKIRERAQRDLERDVMRYTNNVCKELSSVTSEIHESFLGLYKLITKKVVEAQTLAMCLDIFRRMCILCCGMIDMTLTEEEKEKEHAEIRDWLSVKMGNMRIDKEGTDQSEKRDLPSISPSKDMFNIPKLVDRTSKGQIIRIPGYSQKIVPEHETDKDCQLYFIRMYATAVRVQAIGYMLMQTHRFLWSEDDENLRSRVKECIHLFNKTFMIFTYQFEMRFTPESYILFCNINRKDTDEEIIPNVSFLVSKMPLQIENQTDTPDEDDYDSIPDLPQDCEDLDDF